MKFSVLITCVLLLAAVLTSHGQTRGREYVGYRYKGVTPSNILPNGVRHLGGGLIGGINADPVYGISEVSKGKIKMLWLEIATGKDKSGITGWQVKDVLSFYNQRANDHLLFAYDPSVECTRNGKPVENLVGIGKIVRQEGVFRPSTLWVANLKKEKFEPVAATGIKCSYSEP